MTNTKNIQKEIAALNGVLFNDDTIKVGNYFVENLGCEEANEDDFHVYSTRNFSTSYRSQDINKVKEWLNSQNA